MEMESGCQETVKRPSVSRTHPAVAPHSVETVQQGEQPGSIRTMRSFRCQKGKDKANKLVFIGTFKDRECECLETREIKNKRLVELLLPAFQNEVVYYQVDRKELIFPLNARFPGEEEQRIAEEIQKLIITNCCPKPVDIPLRWYGLVGLC